jgi:hypothetical protein
MNRSDLREGTEFLAFSILDPLLIDSAPGYDERKNGSDAPGQLFLGIDNNRLSRGHD